MSNDYQKKAATPGDVKISENVIRSIAGVAAKEVEGVKSLAAAKSSVFNHGTAPVTVQVVNDMVEITVRLVLSSGFRLTVVAEQVQQNVKENVQSMTGVIVSKVHVIASDITFDD